MKVRLIFFIAIFIILNIPAFAQQDGAGLYHLLIGTYTRGKSEGIYVYSFNSRTGEVAYEHTAKGVPNPSYLAVSPGAKFVYSVSRDSTEPGSISAFAFDAHSGSLKFLNKQPSGAEGPCYVSVNQSGRIVFAANYGGGGLVALPVNQDGSLDKGQIILHKGSSVNKERQEKAHVHSVVVSPDNKYLMVPDLGMDQVAVYRINPLNKTSPLSASVPAYAKVAAGSGPRHLVFDNAGRFAYLIQEISGTISVFGYQSGVLTPRQTITMLAPGFKGEVRAADIHLSPDGNFLYGSNRGDANEIVIYAVNPDTGLLTYVGRQSSMGKSPRNFMIDPSGNYLLVANENSDNIFIFKRDQVTGLLSFTGRKIELGAPVCLKMTAMK